MKLQIVKPSDVQHQRKAEPSVRFSKSGLVTFNSATVKALQLSPGDALLIVWEEEQKTYYIGKAPKGMKGFVLTADRSKTKKNAMLKFNSSGFVRQATEKLDLPLQPGKLKSVKYDVDTEHPLEHFGTSLFKIY